MKKTFKRILSCMLAAAIFITAVPCTVFAEESNTVETIVETTEGTKETEGESSESLPEATPSNASPSQLLIAPKKMMLAAAPAVPAKVMFDGSTWMSNLSDATTFSNITVPGTHDTGTFNIVYTKIDDLFDSIMDKIMEAAGKAWGTIIKTILKILMTPFNTVVRELATYAQRVCGQCQALSIEEQLNSGVRSLDLRFRYENGKFTICHGDEHGIKDFMLTCLCYDEHGNRLNLEYCFAEVHQFLTNNPTEVVFLNVQNEGGTYNVQVEKELNALEDKYGIITTYANRSESPSKKDPNGVTLAESRGKAFDITEAKTGTTGPSWDVTVSKKKQLLEEALAGDFDYFKDTSCNIAVKIWLFHDPNKECSFPLYIKYKKILGIPVPCGIGCDFDKFIKSPKSQANEINPFILERLDIYKDYSHPHGLGIVGMDFINDNMCCRVASVNKASGNGPEFEYAGFCDDTWDDFENRNAYAELTDEEMWEIYRLLAGSGNGEHEAAREVVAFTGTYGNPVRNGKWTEIDGFWTYATNASFRNTWGYIYNPYAAEGQNDCDWFWFDDDGHMLTGWQNIGGKWYYLNPEKGNTYGACFMGPGKTPDGYEVDATGAWTGK